MRFQKKKQSKRNKLRKNRIDLINFNVNFTFLWGFGVGFRVRVRVRVRG